MWRFLNNFTRAFRQHVHPRPSAGICAEEEKADFDLFESGVDHQETCGCCSNLPSQFLKKFDYGWVVSERANTGKDDKDGRQSCHHDFHSMFQGQQPIFEAISVGSLMLWGSERERQKRKLKLLCQVLFAVPGGNTTSVLHITGGQQLHTSESVPVKPEEPSRPAIKDAAGAAHDATVNETKADPLDEVFEEFESMCTEYTACSHSLLGIEAIEKGDMDTAVAHLSVSCKHGNSSACFNLGLCYEIGSGVSTNLDKAKFYYKKAADSGHKQALYNLGLMYLNDSTKGEIIHKEGSSDTKHNHGSSDDISPRKRGIGMLEKAARLGLQQAQIYLGIHYMESHNVSKAVSYFKAAAEQNDSEAQYFLAMCYEQGWGVEVNECRAAQLYSTAASAGHDMALYNLGVFNELGLGGLPEDLGTAKDLYKKAAEIGNQQANHRLAELKTEESVESWEEKLNNFESLYQQIHKDQTCLGRSPVDSDTPSSSSDVGTLSSSASSPNLTHGSSVEYFFSTQDKISFDPGGRKADNIKFVLGQGCEPDMKPTKTSHNSKFADVGFENVIGEGSYIQMTTLHRSHTTPDMLLVAM